MSAVTGRLAPWIGRRFDLISWMELLAFSATNYIRIARLSAKLDQIFERIGEELISDDLATSMIETGLPRIREHCEIIGLTMSVKSLDRLSEKVKNRSSSPLKIGAIKIDFAELHQRIEDEIEDNLFLYVPKTHVAWYVLDDLFGTEVRDSFPSTRYDIQEAGKCLALHRNTAAVCHLVRVLEIGLRCLAKKLKVSYENKPWNYVIEVAEKRLNRIRGLKRKPRNWKIDEKFYSEALAHFRFLKDAWRNYSMHVYERYDEGKAESVFNHTKAFMKHLATNLKETP